MNSVIELPVPVKNMPHWRVNFRPLHYNETLIPSLADCKSIVEHHQVRMRGWYYPHINHQPGQSGTGSNWVGGWCGSGSSHTEYWRLYQSAQFIHLFCISEAADSNWHHKLLKDTKNHLRHYNDLDLEKTPGFMSTVNILYTISEIIEFLARLATAGLYEGSVVLDLSLVNVKGFVLTTDWNRAWHEYYAAAENNIHRHQEINIETLLASPTSVTLEWTIWMYERFGWLDPTPNILKKDIEKYRTGKY